MILAGTRDPLKYKVLFLNLIRVPKEMPQHFLGWHLSPPPHYKSGAIKDKDEN